MCIMPATQYPCGCVDIKTTETYYCHRVLEPYADILLDIVRPLGDFPEYPEATEDLHRLYRILNGLEEFPEDDTLVYVQLQTGLDLDGWDENEPPNCKYLIVELEQSLDDDVCRKVVHGPDDEQVAFLEECMENFQDMALAAEKWRRQKLARGVWNQLLGQRNLEFH